MMIQTRWFKDEENLEDCYLIRKKVFIEEQKVPYDEEMDGTDKEAIHLVVYENENAVATGRIIYSDGKFMLGRIAVLSEYRRKGLGDLVVRQLIRKVYNMGGNKQYVHAQTSARGFYEKLGFKAYGDEFEEANILHISMVHEGDVKGGC